jgi:5-formyltetrahydrofolate cyclo-ligase
MSRRCHAMAPEQALGEARRVADRLVGLAELRRASILVLYASLADELPILPIYERARSLGLALAWPRQSGAALDLARCDAWEDLVPGRHGVPEPPEAAPRVAASPGLVILVPGRAFDSLGRRLGRGGGAYDRLLASRAGAFAVGTGYAFQLVGEVPVEAHDERVDAVATPAGLARRP